MPEEGRGRGGLGGLLPETTWRALLALGTPRGFPPGTVLIRQGDEGNAVYVLVAGRVKISRLEASGVEMPIAFRHPGEVLGDIAVLNPRPRTATVTAVDRCSTYVIPAARFARFVAEKGLAGVISQHSVDRMQEAEQHRAELVAYPLPQRVCRVLVRLAEPDGTGGRVLGLNQDELGRMAGAGRNALGLVLAELRRRQIVRTVRQGVIIEDLPALRRFAEVGMPGSATA